MHIHAAHVLNADKHIAVRLDDWHLEEYWRRWIDGYINVAFFCISSRIACAKCFVRQRAHIPHINTSISAMLDIAGDFVWADLVMARARFCRCVIDRRSANIPLIASIQTDYDKWLFAMVSRCGDGIYELIVCLHICNSVPCTSKWKFPDERTGTGSSPGPIGSIVCIEIFEAICIPLGLAIQ